MERTQSSLKLMTKTDEKNNLIATEVISSSSKVMCSSCLKALKNKDYIYFCEVSKKAYCYDCRTKCQVIHNGDHVDYATTLRIDQGSEDV